MSILNVNTIQPVGSAQTVTVSATDLKIGSTTLKSSGGGTFIGNLTGNVTGNINSTGVSTVTTLQGSSNTISIPTGHRVVGVDTGSIRAPGNIIQVVQSVLTSTFSSSAGQNAMVSIGLSATITPSNSANKILIMVTLGGVSGSADTTHGWKIMRNTSTDTLIGDGAGSRARVFAQNGHPYAGGTWRGSEVSMAYVDSPATTSSTTYTVFGGGNGGVTWYVNRTSRDSDGATEDSRGASSIILMEVSG